jgi:hypothetical protein
MATEVLVLVTATGKNVIPLNEQVARKRGVAGRTGSNFKAALRDKMAPLRF